MTQPDSPPTTVGAALLIAGLFLFVVGVSCLLAVGAAHLLTAGAGFCA